MSLFAGVAAPAAAASERYDTIGYPDPQGELKTLSRAEFEKLPLVDRVRLLSGGQLRFFRGGEEVAASAAMGK
jgi:hypothetical protein